MARPFTKATTGSSCRSAHPETTGPIPSNMPTSSPSRQYVLRKVGNRKGIISRGTGGSRLRGRRFLFDGLGITEIEALQDCVEFRKKRRPIAVTHLDFE